MQKQSVIFYGYENIKLKVYMSLISGGDVFQIVISGTPTREEVLEVWEKIIAINGEVNGDFSYNSYFQLLKSYAGLIARYTVEKTLIMDSLLVLRWSNIEELRKRGYKIDVTNTDVYRISLESALGKVSNLITKAVMKRKEIESRFKESARSGKNTGFEEVMASLNAALGFNVDEDLSLSRYNEYKKIIKERNTIKKKEYGRV